MDIRIIVAVAIIMTTPMAITSGITASPPPQLALLHFGARSVAKASAKPTKVNEI